jgi:hypothetical protein
VIQTGRVAPQSPAAAKGKRGDKAVVKQKCSEDVKAEESEAEAEGDASKALKKAAAAKGKLEPRSLPSRWKCPTVSKWRVLSPKMPRSAKRASPAKRKCKAAV